MGVELLATGSIVAAFFAGGVALFAPCCIVFLAPSYLAAATKNHKWKLLPLTFAFAGGLAVILVPITLGVGALAGAVAKYHVQLYLVGALLMFAMAYLTISGKMWSLPSFVRSPDVERGDSGSFFALGVFSGIASSCCAPVLAGVMTLSALSGTAWGGVVLGLAYVFGMAFPLFLMALLWDKAKLTQRSFGRSRPVVLRWGQRQHATTVLNLVLAATFVVMGVWVAALAGRDEMTGGTAAQDWMSDALASFFLRVQDWLAVVPEPILGAALGAVFLAMAWSAIRSRRAARRAEPDEAPVHADTNHDDASAR